MKQLYGRLSRAGFSTQFLRSQVLPNAWEDSMAADDTRYQRLLASLSNHLAINQQSLEDASSPLSFDNSRTRFFQGPDVTDEVDAGLRLVQGITRITLSGVPPSGAVIVPSAMAVRRQILEAGQPWVGFRALLSFCWDSGLPVIHVQNLPAKARRLRGVAIETDGRPAIVLCQQHKYPARHLIPLTHEMGHLAGLHMAFIGLMASTEEEMRFTDRTEAEAHRYATELLTGGQTISPDYRRYRSPNDLVAAVYEQSRTKAIDPGYLIVKRASDSGDWKEASIALSIVEGAESAASLIGAQVRARVDGRRISSASRSFFRNITGVSLADRPETPTADLPDLGLPASPLRPISEPSTFPEALLQRYKTLVRQGYVGQLSPDQADELAAIRTEIQVISRSGQRAQAAAHMVKELNDSLGVLEAEVDTRIAQREAELRGEASQVT